MQRIDVGYQHVDAKWYDLSYHAGNMFRRFRIYGIPIHMKKIIHFKLNIGDTGIYGRSYLASSLNDYEAMAQIERSIAIIAACRRRLAEFIARMAECNLKRRSRFANKVHGRSE